MSTFMQNFNIFFNNILSSVSSLWTWLISTVIGQILISIILIMTFIFILNIIISIGKNK